MRILSILCATALFFSSFIYASDSSITVFAAASTTGPLLEAAKIYKEKTATEIKFSFASSGTLARQIEQGATADIFISASKKWADYASEKGLLDDSTKKQFLGNSLVLISPKGKPAPKIEFTQDFAIDKACPGKLSIGNPAHVPAGKYAQEALNNLKWWDTLKSRMILSKDVRAALRVVEVGEAELGIVYGSDASKSDKVEVVGTFPATSHKPIIYVIARCKNAQDQAQKFIDFLSTPQAAEIFRKFGFIPR